MAVKAWSRCLQGLILLGLSIKVDKSHFSLTGPFNTKLIY